MKRSISSYLETLQSLYSLASCKSVRYSLENMKILFERLNLSLPPIIHVGGTNGKGSVSLKIQKGLENAGFRVGLFSSPHLFSFRERIKINDDLISEEDVITIYQIVQEYAQDLSVTFFEYLFAMALLFFSRKNVDYIICEVGLGGRLDSTNVITPILSVITSIGFDHQDMLGETLEEIASEKAGIIKKWVPVVVGPKARQESIRKKAESMKAKLVLAPEPESAFYDEENSLIAKCALNELGITDTKALHVRPRARFEVFEKAVPMVFDVAHNKDAYEKLFAALFLHFPSRPIRLLAGFSKDKDVLSMLSILEQAAFVHFVSYPHPKLMTKEELKAFSYSKPHHIGSLEEEFDIAYESAQIQKEVLVLSGSFYIMEALYEKLEISHPKDPYQMTETYDLIRG